MRNACSLGLVLGMIGTSVGVGAQPADPELIEKGRKLFFEETFNGNGRTCGTCHPANNNFTIDPSSVRTVRGNDPLFVAEPSGPDLNALEVRRLLRRALVLENLDTFDNPGVMRGVPHTLALRTSRGKMGWSGDGSPGAPFGDGSLRSFATGAVIQHFPKTLNRVEGVDFRLPRPDELEALEAFQLSLGRQADIDLAGTVFLDDTVRAGQALFILSPSRNGAGRSCNGCHRNAGTSDNQFATGVARLPTAPACETGFVAPGDGGHGLDLVVVPRSELCGRGPRGGQLADVEFRGDGTMNAPPLIEAADTAPFFHNNAIATLELAIAFYTSDTFNDSPSGGGNAFVLDQAQINAVGALLRALNALENIRSSNAYAARAIDLDELAPRDELVELALAETTDAIEVLTKGPVELFAGTDAVQLLEEARELERQALEQDPLSTDLLEEAIELKEEARDMMVE